MVVLGAMVLGYTVVYSTLHAILFRHFLDSNFDLAVFAQAVDGIPLGALRITSGKPQVTGR